jgi:hypothetical protein
MHHVLREAGGDGKVKRIDFDFQNETIEQSRDSMNVLLSQNWYGQLLERAPRSNHHDDRPPEYARGSA